MTPQAYARLLGYPDGHAPGEAVSSLADSSRRWYSRHGQPWSRARRIEIVRLGDETIHLPAGLVLRSGVLARRLRRVRADSLAVVAVSAGPEVDEQSEALWRGGRADAAYFLDRYGAAVAESLAAACGRILRQAQAAESRGVLPGYSPGHDGWDLKDQKTVHALLTAGDGEAPLHPLSVLDSGMLTPKNSLLAVFGMTADITLADREWSRGRCAWCSMRHCDFRHLPSNGPPPEGRQ